MAWTHELKDRISKAMEKIMSFGHAHLTSSEEAKRVKVKYDQVYAELDAFEAHIFEKWSGNIIDDSEANLSKHLVVRDEAGLLKVNFDPKVVALLREVKYFNAMQIKVPEKARAVFASGDTLRNFVLNLEHIAKQYNAFKTTLLPVETPLIAKQLADIDLRLEKVEMSVNSCDVSFSSIYSNSFRQCQSLAGGVIRWHRTLRRRVQLWATCRTCSK